MNAILARTMAATRTTLVAVALVAVVVPGCAGLGLDGAAELTRTWEAARVYMPGRSFHYRPATVPAPTAALPTILFLHACAGFFWHDDQWAAILTGAGYGVVMPNSFAREYRPRDCDPATKRGGAFPGAQDMRREEIAYALDRLRNLLWIDARNLFLMGHSEGAGATALWNKPGFKGQIVSAWPCTHRLRPSIDGLWVPAAVPVLVLNFESDPWFPPGHPMHGTCAAKFGRRQNATEVMLKGSGHETVEEPRAREAVLQFLKTYTDR